MSEVEGGRLIAKRVEHVQLDPVHIVQFYDSDAMLDESAAEFLASGWERGDRLLVIATEARRSALRDRLQARGVDLAEACLLDAHETLSKIMLGAMPDWDRVRTTIGSALGSTASRSGQVCAYGEMVNVLWKDGNRAGAIRLEEMWNDLRALHSFSLLCAYVMSSSYEDSEVRAICATHSHVRAPGLDGQPKTPGVAALAGEIAHVKEIESALKKSLHELRLAQAALSDREAASAVASRRTELLFKVTRAIADAIEPAEVFHAVVDEVATALGASSTALWLAREDGQTARLARAVGYGENALSKFESVRIDQQARFPALDALRDRQPLFFDSQASLLVTYPHLAMDVTAGRSYQIACLPVVVHDRCIGVLACTFDDKRTMDEDQRRFLVLVAGHCGQALERLRLLQAETASRAQAETLHELAAIVIRAERVEEVLDAALETMGRALDTNRSAVLLFDDDHVMRFRAWRGLSDAYRAKVEGHSPWSHDERAPSPIVIDDVESDPSMTAFLPLFRTERIGALAFIPLVASGRLIGKFMVYYDRPRRLSMDELTVVRTIANHVAAASARFAAIDELQNTVRFNEMFTAILGHDLRNPLAAIVNAGQLLMMRAEGDRSRKPLARILTSGARMARMIDQLLDFTRARLGTGIPIDAESVDVLPLARQIIDELDDANPDWKLHLTHAGDTVGVWDDDRLGQVLSNLVGNAVRHGVPEHGVNVSIDGTEQATVRVHVHNMGVVPAELLPKLFEPMTGGDRRRDDSQGLGLGLFISQQIARAHGGAISVQSDVASGTTFTLAIPRERS